VQPVTNRRLFSDAASKSLLDSIDGVTEKILKLGEPVSDITNGFIITIE
jgi:hypothetical protein